MGVSLWDPSELFHHDHIGVLLQYAQFRFISTSFHHFCSRYSSCSHSGAYLWCATRFKGIASWLPQLPSSADCVQRRTLISLLQDTFILGWPSNTPYLSFAKGPRFLNMVMTFVLYPLSHYNSITNPRAHFLLSLIENLTIDFPFHFILSLIDVYRDTATCDKLIFSSAITRIIRHASISYP